MAKRDSKIKAVVGLMALVALTIIGQATVSATTFSSDRVAVWIFDVGQGDAIFIDAPDAQILIDGGRNGEVIEKLSAVMPFWDHSIDYVINTHPHADHVAGLNYVLERYNVGEAWVSGQEYGTDVFYFFEEWTQAHDQWRVVKAGDEIDLGAGARLTVLWPEESVEGELLEETHDGNIVVLFEYGDTNVLLTGDFEAEEEMQILDDLDHVDVLKVGHHGSYTSTSEALLEDISPDWAVISVGEGNDYGHPHDSVVRRLRTFGVPILRTDQDGDIRILTDGEEPEIATFDL